MNSRGSSRCRSASLTSRNTPLMALRLMPSLRSLRSSRSVDRDPHQAAPPVTSGACQAHAHHGRAALNGTRSRKGSDFPHLPNHAPCALFTLNPGLQGLLDLVGGLLLALGLFTRPLPFVLAGDTGGRLFHGARAERCLSAAQRGGVGDRPLVRLPLFLGRRGRRMEP
jgi:hypothetical protein